MESNSYHHIKGFVDSYVDLIVQVDTLVSTLKFTALNIQNHQRSCTQPRCTLDSNFAHRGLLPKSSLSEVLQKILSLVRYQELVSIGDIDHDIDALLKESTAPSVADCTTEYISCQDDKSYVLNEMRSVCAFTIRFHRATFLQQLVDLQSVCPALKTMVEFPHLSRISLVLDKLKGDKSDYIFYGIIRRILNQEAMYHFDAFRGLNGRTLDETEKNVLSDFFLGSPDYRCMGSSLT